jgi:hypothetical protein
LASTAALIAENSAAARAGSSFCLLDSMSRTAGMFDVFGFACTAFTCHEGSRPRRVVKGEAVVIQRPESNTMKPESAAAATRKPSRAPRFVASSRYTEPQKSPTAATTTSTPRIVGYQMVGFLMPSAPSRPNRFTERVAP